jgi:ABC-type siderophore export system fused ATPase/permease subunit
MAVVYTNHHLFRENYDEHQYHGNPAYTRYVNQFNLHGIVKVDQATNRVDTNLSKGQQKRLSLLMALLERKPILILDEWAAEQDPKNRALFYQEWLEEIRAMGKTIIAVSHDDDFYYEADRVIKFDFGRIVSDTKKEKSAVPAKLN